jgi:hypothetical protein
MITKPILLASITAALAGTPAIAGTSFSTTFDGSVLDANLSQTHTEPSTTLTLAGTAAFTGGGNNNYRSYVSTVASDYAVSPNNWTATIEVQNTGFVGAQLFFGLGTGTTIDFDAPIYGTPQGSTANEPAAFFMMYDPAFADYNTAPFIRSLGIVRKQFDGAYFSGETNYTDDNFDALVGTSGGVESAAFYRYSMTYDSTAQTLTLDVVQISGFGGTVTNSVAGNITVLNLDGMGYDSSNGKIFFGGNNCTFDNLVVHVNTADYDAWAGSSGYNLSESPFGDDDGDCLSNLEEYAFGLVPNDGSSVNPISSQLNKSTKKFSYTRRKPSLGTNLSYSVWFSDNLVNWTKDTGVAESSPVSNGDNETVPVTLSTLPGDPLPAKLFIQVRAN